MRRRWALLSVISALMFVLTSCGAESSGGNEQVSYKDLKSMVIDILKTEDAQRALQESSQQMSGYNTKLLSAQDQEGVRIAVKDVLVSPQYDKVIKKLMVDPRFAGEFAKAVNKQNKQIHKELIKDPSYQAELIKVMKNPEMDKMILEVLQSTQYRKQVMSLMQESMQNPLFRLEVLELMKKAVQEELKPNPTEKVEKKKDESGGDDQQSDEESDQGDDSGGDQEQSDSGM